MKRTHLVLIILIATAIGVIIATLGDASSYETFQIASDNPKKEFHVVGKLVQKEQMEYNPEVDANKFSFFMQDNNGKTSKVIYKGTKPDHFEHSEQVVIIGKMKDESFHASKILTKCPSKYVDKEGINPVKDSTKY